MEYKQFIIDDVVMDRQIVEIKSNIVTVRLSSTYLGVNTVPIAH